MAEGVNRPLFGLPANAPHVFDGNKWIPMAGSHDGKTAIATPRTAFGEQSVAEPHPIIQVQFPYGINTAQWNTQANGGTASGAASMAIMSTGAGANQSAMIFTKDLVKYSPGQGVMVRCTGLFTTGVENSSQYIGAGGMDEGLFFGYQGAAFGAMHRFGGAKETRLLTVSTASSTAENITITLDGDAKADVAVTASGNVTTTANEIAAADYSGVGRGWEAVAIGDTVCFIAYGASVQTGTYTLSSATSAVGTFAQLIAGVVPTEDFIAQTAWNIDKMDGDGPSGMTLDQTKGNVYQIKFQWLGFGAIEFSIEDDQTGELTPVHLIKYANNNIIPSLGNATLPMCLSAENTSNTTDIVCKAGSFGGFIEGKSEGSRHLHFGKSVTYSGIGITETPILTIRNKLIHNGVPNKVILKVIIASISVEGTKPSIFRYTQNPVLTDASFAAVNASSVVEVDSSATVIAGGVEQYGLGLSKVGQDQMQIANASFLMNPGDTITISGNSVGSGTIVGVASVNWEELF